MNKEIIYRDFTGGLFSDAKAKMMKFINENNIEPIGFSESSVFGGGDVATVYYINK